MDKENITQEILNALRVQSETDSVECKDARGGFPKTSVRKTLSAFGNTHGGILVFGIEETKDKTLSVVGTNDIAVLQEAMTQVSANDMSEVVRLAYHSLTIEGKDVLAVYVPECENRTKPFYIKELGMPRGAYVRDGNTDRQMTDEEVRSYVRNAHVDDFDGTCTDHLTIEDLSQEKIHRFLDRSADRAGRERVQEKECEATLKSIGVLAECEGEVRATIAGYLLFAKDRPQSNLQFERYLVRCVRYKGLGVASDILDKADIDGTLDEQIDRVQAFILRNIANRAEIVGTKRVERYEYPEKAIREIVANAIIHRDYRINETYTQVNIFADRIEVFNPGNLPPGVTVENIRDAQVTRNKVIAGRLKDMDYLEEFGRGIDIVFSEMDAWGLLRPVFKNSVNTFKAILLGEVLSTLNERQVQIWRVLMETRRITRGESMKLFPNVPEHTIRHDLKKMKELGLLEQKGKSVSTFYELGL